LRSTRQKDQFRSIGRTVYKNIKRLCKESHVTVESLELNLQIAKNSVSRWGQGKIVPRLDVLMVIADMFGISLDELITEHTDDWE
jgi:transcriptional regulator with XRE-family HTH domain